jgi:hypothetical protein
MSVSKLIIFAVNYLNYLFARRLVNTR